MKNITLVLLVLCTTIGCVKKQEPPHPTNVQVGPARNPTEPSAPRAAQIPVYYGSEVAEKGGATRFIDGDANVLCYQSGYEVSCVSLSHTTLRPDGSSRTAPRSK